MKKKIYTLCTVLFIITSVSTRAQFIQFSDANFKAALIAQGVDSNDDGEISEDEASQITDLELSNKGIKSLEGIHYFADLISLDVSNNNLTDLDLRGLQMLHYIQCDHNNISEIYLEPSNVLYLFSCAHNSLSSLDLSNVYVDSLLDCSNNHLESLNLKNGHFDYSPDFSENPDLKIICVDKNELATIQQIVTNNRMENTVVGSYCSFDPGGNSYVLTGKVRADLDNNGCDENDDLVPGVHIRSKEGANEGFVISDVNGSYKLAVNAGEYDITAEPNYPWANVVNPSSFHVTFPNDGAIVNQDVCITGIDDYEDVKVTVVPIWGARPGFQTQLKLIIQNKGIWPSSGIVSLDYNDEVLLYQDSGPAISSNQDGKLTWSYEALEPFQRQEFFVIFLCNKPTDTPPLNDGDLLDYTGYVYPDNGDEDPSDNEFDLSQLVLNSHDPNDKTCLEGNVVAEETIGEYVHYLIRFENTGSANAINVVVKDEIDLNKFQINSLNVVSSSHDVVTKVENGVVEFIFENIDLPFDDDHNDGYVAFEIKLSEDLKLGDIFENTAEIYFDFNFPIITNKAATKIDKLAALTRDNWELGKITSFPSPVKDKVYIHSHQPIVHAKLMDAQGRLLKQVHFSARSKEEDMDLNGIANGNYYLLIETTESHTVQLVRKVQ